MMTRNPLFAAVGGLVLAMALAGCEGDDGSDGTPGPAGAPGTDGAPGAEGAPGSDANAALALTFLGRTAPLGAFDESAAEIVAYHPATVRAFVVNAEVGKVDIVDLQDPTAPNRIDTLDVAADVESAEGLPEGAMGDVNSVDISGDTLAVALAADVAQENGYLAFYSTDGTYLSAVEAGALPDKVGFSPDGRYAVSANEGEPNDDYSVDPEGSLTIVDLSAGFDNLVATTADFTAFNVGGSKTLTGPVRVSAKAESVARDLEPEFVAFSADSSTVYATLQENNAVAIADLASGTVSAVLGIGFKDYGLPGNEFDASNRDGGVNIRNWSVYGTYMPDGFDSYEVAGTTYLVTANEGDGREYVTDAADDAACAAQGGFLFDDGDCFHYLDELRVKDLDPSQFTDELKARLGPDFQANENLGRLKMITDLGLVDSDACVTLATTGQPLLYPDETPAAGCVYEALYSFGARSFTIWDTDTGRPVFDSGSDFEVITAQQLGEGFNASNDDDEGDARSDDKGPEPEAVEIAELGGNVFAFIALERVGGIMVYNITNPQNASFVQYVSSRAFSEGAETDVAAGISDLGPEDIKFVPAADSPTGEPLLLVSNEVSGTLAVYSVTLL
ncbi:choice-of-anchor I family protein [Pseudohaliea rubra]|uniref:Alkaline phosphatase n=1 Tax=Pseudohaliea rubra DSM 19751 TaxID=1265313 RepID=A0A095VSL9_9GAMM|nr:choice-of-anchor I family protein [Pseudohaliea rubra]KGE04457.1 Alkaline phosphatase [Pseudohaliea rubra DSM 19751]